MFFLLARFYARPMSYKALILAFQLNIFNEKGVICVEEEKFGLPVDVRGSKTSVLKLCSVPPRSNTITSRDQFKPMRIGEDLVVNYKTR